MIIGYLTSVYPAHSHSFIRREIAAVEALGHEVRRYSIRSGGVLKDAADLAEQRRTAVVLGPGASELVPAVLGALVRFRSFLAALRIAVGTGHRSPRGVLRHLAYLAEACLLLRWCRRDGVEHLHAHFGTNPAMVAMLTRVLGGPAYSFTAHGSETFDAPQLLALDEKIARAAFTVAVSEYGRTQLCRWSDPAHASRIHVVRCGLEPRLLARPLEPVPAARRLVCVGRLSPEKGHAPLLRAVARLHRAGRELELVLVGDGPLRAQLEALAAQLGVSGCVRFAGWEDGDGVRREMLAARALVVSSLSEGLPVVIMEALARGRPCIASRISGIPELVEPGVNGWLVPAGDDGALAAAMAEALDAPPEALGRMGRAGALRVAERHDVSREAARKVALFDAATREDVDEDSVARLHRALDVASAPPVTRSRVVRWTGAHLWRATGRAERNRAELYGGAGGLRIVMFHLTPREDLETVKRVVEWWRERWPMATPADADDLVAGRLPVWRQDRLLVTFDDGLARHHQAAAWLAEAGVQAVFFVIPSLLDRTMAQFVRYHADRGVRAFPPVADGSVRGLSTSQVREMIAMGHRIGGHNDAHRDLGSLRGAEDLRYEIDQSLARVGELTGAPCGDFAVGFGQPHNLAPEAAQYLRQRCANVYMCHRGLNVPGRTPRFLLRHAHELSYPLAFTKICLAGGADHRLATRMRAMAARVGLLPEAEAAAAAEVECARAPREPDAA